MPGESASSSNTTLAVEFDSEKIDAIFARLDQCHLPGAAVGIAIGGTPVYRKGFGLANMDLPVVLSPTIRMRIASTTKHFACLAYMLLCEEGKARLDDTIEMYLPELHAATRKVTMRQLMGHTSGLRDVCDITWQLSGIDGAVSMLELLSLYHDIDDVNAAPGTAYSYNNGGYLILSVAIERIAGQSLSDVLRERIFEPVGMYATQLRSWEKDFVCNSAAAHMMNSAGRYEKSNFFGTVSTGDGAIVSTVDDMLRWLVHMDAPVVGSMATWEAMKAPQKLANGVSTGYGLGLQIGRYRGVEVLFHAGGGMGSNSQMLKVPPAGLDVAIMVNRSDVWAMELTERILDACLPGLDPLKEKPCGPFASGIFRSPRTGRVIQLFPRQGQQFVSIDGMDIPVELRNDGALWPVGVFREVRQAVTLVGEPENPISIRFTDCGNVDELMGEKPDRARETDLRAVAGSYRSDTTGTKAAISETDDGPRLVSVGRFGLVVYALECLADRIWRAKSSRYRYFDAILLFDGDGGAFHFSTYRTRALKFRRDA